MPPRAEPRTPAPYWQTTDGETVRLYHGHVTSVLGQLAAKSVQCVVTSPPYWGLRDYKAGADEIGREKTPQEFVEKMVAVFRAVRRVLRDDGVAWLNLGDSYTSGGRGSYDADDKWDGARAKGSRPDAALPSGNLVGVPWRVALALQADGWVLRQDVIWHKPAPMPESVTSRCTKAHEHVFLLTKSMDYYYDWVGVSEESVRPGHVPGGRKNFTGAAAEANGRKKGHTRATLADKPTGEISNLRDVWTMSSGGGYAGGHFATFPVELPSRCIRAGTSEFGCCRACGTPAVRRVRETKLVRDRPNSYVKRTGGEGTGNSCPNEVDGVSVETVGWACPCPCGHSAGTRPCVVLDPFVGSGTTMEACLRLGRHGVGIDLSEEYLRDHAVERVVGVVRGSVRLAGGGLLPPRAVVPYRASGVRVGKRV